MKNLNFKNELYIESDLFGYYKNDFSHAEKIQAEKYDSQLVNVSTNILLPLSLFVLGNVVVANAAEQFVNQTTTRTWTQFAKEFTGVDVLLDAKASVCKKALQATRTITGATSSTCLAIAPFVSLESPLFRKIELTYAYSTITYAGAWLAGKFVTK